MKRLLLFYTLLFAGFTAFYILLFHAPLFAVQQVLFYRGLLLLPVAVIAAIGALLIVRTKLKGIHVESIVAGLILCVSLNLAFFVVFPVTFDRSVTMSILNDLKVNSQITSCTGLSKEDIRNHFINSYVFDEDAIGRRIKEQSQIGFLEGSDECTSLTPRAREFLRFADTVSAVYGVRK